MAKKKPVTKEYLKCILTDSEKLAVRNWERKLAWDETRRELRSEQDRLKEVQTHIKAEIAKIEAEIGLTSGTLANGYEYRNVECAGEVLQPTRMSNDECQVHLFEQEVEEEEQPA